MGHFDKTICDCCVCPMQCVLEQLVGQQVRILTLDIDQSGTLTYVDNFIAFLDIGGGTINTFPIHNICAVQIVQPEPFDFKLKPIKKSVGECSCIEDPTTNLAKSMIGDETTIIAGQFEENGTISDVGGGIVILSGVFGPCPPQPFTAAISSCKIQGIGSFE